MYKRYIKKGGKVFGPYYYESYRDIHGITRTRFVSGPENENKKFKLNPSKLLLILGIFLLVMVLLFVGNLSYDFNTTARVIDASLNESEV